MTLASRIARACAPQACIALCGELGAGKSTFARGFIQALCGAVEVSSPTYALMQEYGSPQAFITHMDLYRLEHADMLEEIGFTEALSRGIALIEWPEIAAGLLPEGHLALAFTVENDTTRRLVGKAGAAWYAALLQAGVIS